MHQYPHAPLIVWGIYNFLKDPHGLVFHGIRWVARWTVEMLFLGIALFVLANVIVGIAHFGFHVPVPEIIATIHRVDAFAQHVRQMVEALQKKL